MASSRKKGKKWIWIPLLVLLAALVVGVVLLIVGGRGISARYDDPAALLREYDSAQTPGVTLREDGSALLRLTREDLYWYAQKYGLLDALRQRLADEGITAAGFRLSDGKLTVYARCRVWGFLPLNYQAAADLAWEDGIVLRTQKLSFGSHMTIPRGRWPAIFSRAFVIPAEDISPRLTDAYLDADALVLVHEGLPASLTGTLPVDEEALHAMALFGVHGGGDARIEDFLRTLPDGQLASEVANALLALDDGEDAFARLLSLCQSDAVRALWANEDALTRDMLVSPLLRRADALREERESALAAEQARYEKLLQAVRETYKSGGLAVSETGFVTLATGQNFDPAALTTLSASPTDCRIVFLWSPQGGGEFCSRDMPPASEVLRTDKKAMRDRLDPAVAYDLGVTLTSEGSVPLLLYRRADDTFVLREIGEAVYVSLLVEHSNPVLDMSALPAPGGSIARRAGEGWSGAMILTAPEA